MRVIWKTLIAGAFVIAAVAISQTNSRSGPVFTKDGDLVLPTGFREWIFMGGPITPNSLNGGEAPFPEFHDVYIERENLLYYHEHEQVGFFTFGHRAPPYSPSAKVMPAEQCASCHIAGVAKTDMVWVQYYPLLRAKLQ